MATNESNTTKAYEEQPPTVPADHRSVPGAPIKVRQYGKRLSAEGTSDDSTESPCKKPKEDVSSDGTPIVTVRVSQHSEKMQLRVIVAGETVLIKVIEPGVTLTRVFDPNHVLVIQPADKSN
jgi:hypothetical protein|tara:strand:- start:350 stop:715 length:366 start_codon:yes stop_codon:yes gene_type:complete